MSSSSSSGYSDEDAEAPAPSAAAPPSASQLGQAVELAQICSFCATFRQPLRLPSFSRTELQEAILGASNGETTHLELLAELHFKLAREHPTAKMEKMVQDWEKTLARKLQENWRKEFTANPMGGGVTYRDLTVFERVKILDALCHWKLDTCAEIHKHIATLQKENDNEAIKRLRGGEIGTDDNGVSYWYFDDGCWIYAEDKPRWQREERKPSYLVEFASAKRIRLSINFDPDHNAIEATEVNPSEATPFADDAAKPLGPALTSPTDPAAAPETFDITCESCKKCYDMRWPRCGIVFQETKFVVEGSEQFFIVEEVKEKLE
ncbi:Transcription initiation factor TFIID [Phytophthora cinnamomi]|uniref:Transcription initiation factor TFIID n=1 Tax=Phytophthora cinnamomi TaxID=4785 RepID=UPI00355A4FDC|nr:Transcription initiation factor TFIID [Phytophthora cinnamomi]